MSKKTISEDASNQKSIIKTKHHGAPNTRKEKQSPSKAQTATSEQLRFVNPSNSVDENELQGKVNQIMELTACNEEQAAMALNDTDYDIERAINLILEQLQNATDFTSGESFEPAMQKNWQMTSAVKKSSKRISHSTITRMEDPVSNDSWDDVQTLGSTEGRSSSDNIPRRRNRRQRSDNKDFDKTNQGGTGSVRALNGEWSGTNKDQNKSISRGKREDKTTRGRVFRNSKLASATSDELTPVLPLTEETQCTNEGESSNTVETVDANGWDEAADWEGVNEWTGTPIVVTNSSVQWEPVSTTIQDSFPIDELIEPTMEKSSKNECILTSSTHGTSTEDLKPVASREERRIQACNAIFIPRDQSSSRPPAACSRIPDVPVHLAISLNTHIDHSPVFNFGDNPFPHEETKIIVTPLQDTRLDTSDQSSSYVAPLVEKDNIVSVDLHTKGESFVDVGFVDNQPSFTTTAPGFQPGNESEEAFRSVETNPGNSFTSGYSQSPEANLSEKMSRLTLLSQEPVNDGLVSSGIPLQSQQDNQTRPVVQQPSKIECSAPPGIAPTPYASNVPFPSVPIDAEQQRYAYEMHQHHVSSDTSQQNSNSGVSSASNSIRSSSMSAANNKQTGCVDTQWNANAMMTQQQFVYLNYLAMMSQGQLYPMLPNFPHQGTPSVTQSQSSSANPQQQFAPGVIKNVSGLQYGFTGQPSQNFEDTDMKYSGKSEYASGMKAPTASTFGGASTTADQTKNSTATNSSGIPGGITGASGAANGNNHYQTHQQHVGYPNQMYNNFVMSGPGAGPHHNIFHPGLPMSGPMTAHNQQQDSANHRAAMANPHHGHLHKMSSMQPSQHKSYTSTQGNYWTKN